MSVDPKPEADADDGEARLPPRAESTGAEDAQARLLARVVGGGLKAAEPGAARRIGPYRLMRELGRGGMGEVWDARDADDGPVAIKILRAAVAAHEPTRKRFLREARTAAAIEHERIVRIVDVGSTDAGTPYIVMERLPGRPLEAIVREHGAPPWEAARTILTQIAEGLAFAHAQGVIHRDLKPANVMVDGGLEDPRCTIIDFGLARREVISSGSESLSRTGEVFGSPPFMSPEQFRGDDVDARTDIYSFGCLMYFVLTGRRPFEGEKIGELMYKHLFEAAPYPEPMVAPKRLRPALAAITLRALRKVPDRRFATMGALVLALRRVETDPTPIEVPEEGEVVGSTTAGAVSPEPAPRRWLPWMVAAAAVAVGGLATAGVFRDAPTPARADETPSPPPAKAVPPPDAPEAADDAAAAPPEPVATVEAPAPEPAPVQPPAGEPPAETAPPGVEPPKRRPASRKRPKPAPEASPAATPTSTEPPTSELPPNPFRSPPDGSDATP